MQIKGGKKGEIRVYTSFSKFFPQDFGSRTKSAVIFAGIITGTAVIFFEMNRLDLNRINPKPQCIVLVQDAVVPAEAALFKE